MAIQHNLENWDLWYSVSGPAGPWIEIAVDLPAGDPSAGSIHTFDWVIPDEHSAEVRVRVRQDNAGKDYYDVSENDLAIVAAPPSCPADINGSGGVNPSDLAFLLANWGFCGEDCEADVNQDQTVNASDLALVLAAWGACPD